MKKLTLLLALIVGISAFATTKNSYKYTEQVTNENSLKTVTTKTVVTVDEVYKRDPSTAEVLIPNAINPEDVYEVSVNFKNGARERIRNTTPPGSEERSFIILHDPPKRKTNGITNCYIQMGDDYQNGIYRQIPVFVQDD